MEDWTLNLVQFPAPDVDAGQPLWLGVEQTEDANTLSRVTPVAGEDPEAIGWFRSRVGTAIDKHLSSCFYETFIFEQGRETYVGIHRVKFVSEP